MRRVAIIKTLLIVLCLGLSSCRHPVPEGPAMSFSKDVQPIIIANCTQSGCHGANNPHEFTLLTYEDVMDHGDVKAGNSKQSKLYEVITANGGEEFMPKDNPPLSEPQIKRIYLWIEQGAQNN